MIPTAKIPPAPTRSELGATLGHTHVLWEQVRHVLNRECIPLTEEWVYSGRRHGWALRFRHKQRIVLYLKSLDRYFRATVALEKTAVAEARKRPLPLPTLQVIDHAEAWHGESVVRVDVRDRDHMLVVEQLIAITMECSAPLEEVDGSTMRRTLAQGTFAGTRLHARP